MNWAQSIILGYQEYNPPYDLSGLQKWILRDLNVKFGKTRSETCSFLICLLEDLTFLQEWLDILRVLLRLTKPTWVHNVRISFFPERDRVHWIIPNNLLQFLDDYHLRLIISFTGWGDEKCGRHEGRILRDVTYQPMRQKYFLLPKREYTMIKHITLYTSNDMDSFSISPRKLRKCRQKGAGLIISIRRLS